MSRKGFRWVFLPYCVRQNHDDGTFSVLNRDYEDLGTTQSGSPGQSHGRHYHFKKAGEVALREAAVNVVAHPHPRNETFYFLYDGSCPPDSGSAEWTAYSERLSALLRLVVET